MGLLGKIATLASVGLPAKAAKNAIAGRAAASAATTTATASPPPPPPPPGASGAGGTATATASRAKTMAGGTSWGSPPPPPKAGQNVYAAGGDFNKKTKPEPVRNAWREGGKK